MAPDRSYQETIEYLYGLQKHGVKLALSNSIALMSYLGEPHRRFRTVHVAGTNGKGSTAAFLVSMLNEAGYRVGLYTSPHLVSFTERIRINGTPITEEKVVELAQRVRQAYADVSASAAESLNPTFFEVTTAVAFTYFAEESADIAVIEVGMGGRLDATNVIVPLVSIITNIELEHTEYLGNTLQAIAFEKAGIIKPLVPVVTAAMQPEVLSVIEQQAEIKKAPLYRLGRDFKSRRISSGREQEFDYNGIRAPLNGLEIGLHGDYQVSNASLALAAVECLHAGGVTVEEDAIRRGLLHTFWEGRLERVAEKPDIYLDGAHNPAAAAMLAKAIGDLKNAYRRLVLIIGILGDKDSRGIISQLVPAADQVIVTRPDYGRAMDTAVLAAQVKTIHADVDTADTVAEAIRKARAVAGPNDLILITGSLYVVGDARAALHAGNPNRTLSRLKG